MDPTTATSSAGTPAAPVQPGSSVGVRSHVDQHVSASLSDSRTGRVPGRVTATEAVLAHLRKAVEGGRYPIGTKLPSEASLATELRVSRPVVREALRALQALGLTETASGKGTFVTAARPTDNPRFGPYSARDLVELRRHVEVPGAGYAATRRTDADLETLVGLVRRLEEEQDGAVWVALDSLFHIAVARASGNPAFGKVIVDIREALASQSSFVNQVAGRIAASNVEHRRILDAIAGRDAEFAVTAMSDHLGHVDRALGEIVRGRHAE